MLKKQNTVIFKNNLINQIALDMGREPSASDAIEYILESCDYSLIKYKKSNRTIFNRLNVLWVWPLFLIFAPFQWIVTGDTGFDREKFAGRVLNYLVKYDE
jgi:hypothetical protein